jgi:DNA-binding transcriptional MerR regulator
VIDTLKFAKRLREAGFSDPQAEAMVATVQEAEGAESATKADLGELNAELKAEIAELRAELKLETSGVRSEMQQVELHLEAKIEAAKADTLNRIFGLILGTLVVNIVAIVGAMFGVARLLEH